MQCMLTWTTSNMFCVSDVHGVFQCAWSFTLFRVLSICQICFIYCDEPGTDPFWPIELCFPTGFVGHTLWVTAHALWFLPILAHWRITCFYLSVGGVGGLRQSEPQGAFSDSAGTAPSITLLIPGTPLKATHLQKRA